MDELNQEQPLEQTAPPALLPLDVPRVVTIKSKTHSYLLRFRRLTHEDWQKYFTSIVHQTRNFQEYREEIFETETAQIELVDRALISAEGYGDLTGVKDWKKAIPIFHRAAAGVALRSVGIERPSVDADEPIFCDLVETRLAANWSAVDGERMMQYAGLVHRFRQPSVSQLKRFNFESARVRVTGTAEAGVTTYPARQAIAMKIYDELIESVDGYAVDGHALTGVENITREMDGAHKAEAALALFRPGADIELV